jgi:large subunit ribosomal protein L4e
MAKLQILDATGKKSKEITSNLFETEIRKDIVQKVAETEKEKQPYAPYLWAGMETSASGNVKHNRHVWKSDRGKGLSRYPKKRMSDKGERFVWVAAVIPGVRKGRRAHPPKILRADVKINKKEKIFALLSCLAMTSSKEEILNKYSSMIGKEIKINLPLVFDSKILNTKTKDFFSSLRTILGEDLWNIAIQSKEIRAGKGKKRNRRYKSNAGMLLVIGNNENKKISGLDVVKANELKVLDIFSNGARLTAFTEEAVKDLENKVNGTRKEEKKVEVKPVKKIGAKK